jgi:hypothetical protein
MDARIREILWTVTDESDLIVQAEKEKE